MTEDPTPVTHPPAAAPRPALVRVGTILNWFALAGAVAPGLIFAAMTIGTAGVAGVGWALLITAVLFAGLLSRVTLAVFAVAALLILVGRRGSRPGTARPGTAALVCAVLGAAVSLAAALVGPQLVG